MSTVERISEFLRRIEAQNTHINAILSINPHALDESKKIDAKIRSGKAGKLAGLGIIVKSNISVKGLPVTCGSKVLENYIGTYDADVIKRIKEQDGIILGMANCDEFACGMSGENSAFGPTLNPAAPDRVPGGSSSGSAAAIAADFCDISLGSETGGSIRQPASHCGIYGFKPTYGFVSRHGLIDLSMSLDSIGPLAKDAAALARMMDVISGHSENDGRTQPHARMDFFAKEDLRGKTIGICPKLRGMCTDVRIYDAVDKAAHKMRDAGAKLVDIDIPYIDLAVQTYYPLVYVELFSGTRKFDGKKYGRPIEENCGEEVLRRILGGKEISRAEHQGRYYRLALRAQQAIKRGVQQALSKVDFVVLPVTPSLPPKIGKRIDVREEYAYDAFTIPANLAGICAASVPITKIDSVPVGMQMWAQSFNDAKLLRVIEGMPHAALQ